MKTKVTFNLNGKEYMLGFAIDPGFGYYPNSVEQQKKYAEQSLVRAVAAKIAEDIKIVWEPI
jgi:hypothetical protein